MHITINHRQEIDDQPDGMQQQTTISRHPFSCNISSASLQHLHLSFCAVKKRTTRRRQEGTARV